MDALVAALEVDAMSVEAWESVATALAIAPVAEKRIVRRLTTALTAACAACAAASASGGGGGPAGEALRAMAAAAAALLGNTGGDSSTGGGAGGDGAYHNAHAALVHAEEALDVAASAALLTLTLALAASPERDAAGAVAGAEAQRRLAATVVAVASSYVRHAAARRGAGGPSCGGGLVGRTALRGSGGSGGGDARDGIVESWVAMCGTVRHVIRSTSATSCYRRCLVLRFIRGDWVPDVDSTVGAAFLTKSILLDTADVKVEIWDTAGQERYRSLAPMYWRGSQAAVVVFDVTSRDSFEGAKTW